MIRFVFLAMTASLASVFAQQAAPAPVPSTPVSAFAIRPPDEASPFFFDPLREKQAESTGPGPSTTTVSEYPKNRGAENSAWAQFSGFFTGMFSSVNLGPIRSVPPVTSKVAVDPTVFPLQDRREVNVTYTIQNNTKKIMRLEYPTSQRIDILTYDAQGNVIDKWSDDRSFTPEEGIVVINPKERIEYQEKIPTREMKPEQTYRIDSFATTEPNFLTQETISPQ